MKIETHTASKLPRHTVARLNKILAVIPSDHLRGIQRLKIVDFIDNPKLRQQAATLPGLYVPRQGTQPASIEIATKVLLPTGQSLSKRLFARLSFYNNLAATIYSLIGQHYYLTMRHSVKRTQIEPSVRRYTEERLKAWNENQHSFRAKIFKPLQPTLEKWAKSLQKQATRRKT